MFGGLMGMFDNDPFFGDIGSIHRRQMQQMNDMMRDPFGMMMRDPHQLSLTDGTQRGHERSRDIQRRGERHQQQDLARRDMFGHDDMFGGLFSNMHGMMGGMMANMNNMQHQMMQAANNHDGHMYTQSSFMSYSSAGNGAPKVYQATSSTRQAPGGIKETRRAVRDSESGLQKMAVGHHINERGHVITRSQNVRTDERDESQEFLNIDEEEAGRFDEEWRQRTSNFSRRSRPAISNAEGRSRYDPTGHHRRRRTPAIEYRERD